LQDFACLITGRLRCSFLFNGVSDIFCRGFVHRFYCQCSVTDDIHRTESAAPRIAKTCITPSENLVFVFSSRCDQLIKVCVFPFRVDCTVLHFVIGNNLVTEPLQQSFKLFRSDLDLLTRRDPEATHFGTATNPSSSTTQ
jgi:hypothetical protein